MTECPECGTQLQRNDMIEGEIFSCSDCGVELEVTSTTPFTVSPAPREEEDWGE